MPDPVTSVASATITAAVAFAWSSLRVSRYALAHAAATGGDHNRVTHSFVIAAFLSIVTTYPSKYERLGTG